MSETSGETGTGGAGERIAGDRLAAERLADLLTVMRALRGPDGCPWDREQDERTLRQFVLEEACEVIDAIDGGDPDKLCDELGDLLLQIVFLAQVSAEKSNFRMADVIRSIHDKLVRRHPHVFGDVEVADAREVVDNWEAFKTRERDGVSVLDDVPPSLPALARAEKFGRRASQIGFDWERPLEVLAKIREELDELEEEVRRDEETPATPRPGDAEGTGHRIEEELGDLLFSVANLARHLEQSPEIALRHANAKFEARFRRLERKIEEADRTSVSPEELEGIWESVKSEAAHPGRPDESEGASSPPADEAGDGGAEEVEERQRDADE